MSLKQGTTPIESTGVSKGRLLLLGILFMTIFSLLLGHLYVLQVVNNRRYEKEAEIVAQRSSIIPPQRGRIYDRYRHTLVTNVDSFAINVIPASVEDWESFLGRAASLLDLPQVELEKAIPREKRKGYQPIEIKDGVPFERVVYFAEHAELFPGVTWNSKPLRYQRAPGSISHILGYVGNITTEELQVLYNRGYHRQSIVGKAGIEKVYDIILSGKEGTRYNIVNAKGQLVKDAPKVDPPINGKDITLTIDNRIQILAEKALGNNRGSVVVLQPATGEILAMVSYPWVDTNRLISSGSDYFHSLLRRGDYPFLHRTIQSTYPPASTFKLVMYTAIREERAFPKHKTIYCPGYVFIGDRKFHCNLKTGHGHVDLERGLAYSCNVYFGTLGTKHLGIDRIVKYARIFGLGEKTNIDLDGERAGLVPTSAWKEETKGTLWTPGDTCNTSIGQGFLQVTPLQIANIVAAIANKGVVYRPHVLRSVLDPVSEEESETIDPELLRKLPLSEETITGLQRDMRKVVVEGSARWTVQTKAVEVAGKTGTAETKKGGGEESWHSWFASYGPYKTEVPDERIVVVVIVEASEDGWAGESSVIADLIYQGVFAEQTYEEVVEHVKRRRLWYVRHLLEREREDDEKPPEA